MTLVQDPGRASKPVLISRFMRARLRGVRRRTALRLGLKRLDAVLPEHWQAPDSELAKRAQRLAEAVCPEFMVLHSHRTYCFGAMLAGRNRLKLDREVLFVSALLHDLGLSDKHKDDPGSFEWVSARLAYDFCHENDVEEARAALVHDAIALHASAGIADTKQPEIAMVHYGAGMDLFGMGMDELPRTSVEEILEAHPRDGFKTCFGPCLHHQAQTKPNSSIAGAVAMGLSDMIVHNLKA